MRIAQRAARVFAARDLDLIGGPVAHHMDVTGRHDPVGLRTDDDLVAVPDHRQIHMRRFQGMLADQVRQLHRMRSDHIVLTVDDHLRRVDHLPAAGARIGLLPRGEGPLGKDILPPDVVPVVHVQGQRDHVVPFTQLRQDFIRRRTGGTALRGEQLDHHGIVLRPCRPGHSHPARRDETRESAHEDRAPACPFTVCVYPTRFGNANQGFERASDACNCIIRRPGALPDAGVAQKLWATVYKNAAPPLIGGPPLGQERRKYPISSPHRRYPMTITVGHDSAQTRKTLEAGGQSVAYYSLPAAEAAGLGDFTRLPAALKVVLENMLRFEDGKTVTLDDIRAFSDWAENGGRANRELAYRPARVLMQDFTGVPAVVDLAAMRDGIQALGGDPQKINPLNPVDLVIDHSVMIDEFGNPRAFQMNVDREYERNMERYQFLKWGQGAFNNFRVVPPGTGICHQVNLEYLAQTVWTDEDQNGETVAYPDTLVGTDSHTTMVNGAAVLGWGVGGIEAEAAMLGQPISMLIPEVVGFELTGEMIEGTTGTDLVLKVVQMLREKGVVGKFVEFYGSGLDTLPLADRATIANLAPEYGATCGFFPIDDETLRYLRNTGREEDRVALVEAYAKENGFWRGPDYAPVYTDTLHLDMGTIVPAISGPKRPQDYIALDKAAPEFHECVKGQRAAKDAAPREEIRWEGEGGQPEPKDIPGDEGTHKRGYVSSDNGNYQLHDGSIVIASITSCTNTSNPYVMIG